MIQVTAAIIKNDTGDILICQRGPGGSTAFLWEFPGGKRELDETLEECLQRECFEELGVKINVGDLFGETRYHYPEGRLAFSFYSAEIVTGDPIPSVHNDIRWVRPEALDKYEFCPADIEIINRLRLYTL